MNMTLYHGEPNGPSFSVLAALFEKGLQADLVRIDLAEGARHELACAQQPEVEMSVEGEGPVLMVDGEAMTDSVFIACYLDDVGPGAPLRPASPYGRWETMTWCRQMIERTAPAAAMLGCNAHPPKLNPVTLAKIGSADLRARWEMIGAGVFAEDKLADSRAKVAAAVEKIEARLAGRSWLMGEFTIADPESYAWLAGMVKVVPQGFAGKSLTMAWMERVKGRPAVQEVLALARVADPAAYWAPGPEINRWG
ncbi:MAG: glutathione S-transferase family protein [Steroidobacteraceae bacterium]